ncbi:proline-rich protein 19 [Suncus etruscus]|uniref:proline-rich protein 19 n=1 Tax=Suncus etruscus TaxID=109475 RepID=UPI00210FC176|nr:proline-rich protein 19 [Suncus etruscus]
MDLQGPAPQPLQRPEKPGRVRRRKTRRERNEVLMGSRRSLVPQNPLGANRDPPGALWDPGASAASRLMVITQGRLSRDHRGLFNHEVKSLDVTRLLSCGSLEPSTPILPIRPSPNPDRAQEIAPPSQGKENQVPGGSGPGPPSSSKLPCLEHLLEELKCQLSLPPAFPRRNVIQETRNIIVSTLYACHGAVPDLTLVLRGGQPPLTGTKPGTPEKQRMTPTWIDSLEHSPGEARHLRRQGPRKPTFDIHHASSTPPHRDPCPPPLTSLSSPLGAVLGPPTAFDMLKSIWLVTSPPAPRPWGIGPQPLHQPPSPLWPQTSALDWSPSPPASLPSLSQVVTQSSPEAWSFPPMRLY